MECVGETIRRLADPQSQGVLFDAHRDVYDMVVRDSWLALAEFPSV